MLLLLAVVPLTVAAQTVAAEKTTGKRIAFEAVVIDAQSHRLLPFASVYASPTSSTITNAEGSFTIKCDSTDVLRISYVGYKTLYIRASQLGSQVELWPMENLLKEVVVKPLDLKNFIRKTTKEMRRQLRKHEKRESNFFYRQIAFSDTTCYELMEAFLNARSAVYLQNLFLLKGRFAGIQPDSLHKYAFYTNFFTVSSLPMLTRYDFTGNADIKPLTRNYRDFYNVDYDVMSDGDNRLVAVRFIPKEDVKKSALDVTLYVDQKTHHLRKMEGRVDYPILQKDYHVLHLTDTTETLKTEIILDTATFNLTVNMTEDRGFVEVQSVYIDEQHERYGKQFNTRSILFNVGDQLPSKGRKMWSSGDLHKYICEQDDDPEFWHENEVVRRTPVEEHVMRLFEHRNLFGNMKPD